MNDLFHLVQLICIHTLNFFLFYNLWDFLNNKSSDTKNFTTVEVKYYDWYTIKVMLVVGSCKSNVAPITLAPLQLYKL